MSASAVPKHLITPILHVFTASLSFLFSSNEIEMHAMHGLSSKDTFYKVGHALQSHQYTAVFLIQSHCSSYLLHHLSQIYLLLYSVSSL